MLSHTHPTESQINIFTDGSLTEEHAGSGYTIQYKKCEILADSIKLPLHTTVFQAEIIAINEAIKDFSLTKAQNMQYIKIFWDSQAAIKALNSNIITSLLVKQTNESLNKLANEVARLEICWIKAHIGHEGNERADQLAREAVKCSEIRLKTPPSCSTYKQEVKNKIYSEWELRWTADNAYRMIKKIFPKPHCTKSKEILHLKRTEIKTLVEVISGQNNLNYMNNKIYGTDDLCRFCEEGEETFDHLINECPCFYLDRCDLIKDQLIINSLDWNPDIFFKGLASHNSVMPLCVYFAHLLYMPIMIQC